MVEVVAALIWSGDNFLICKRPPEKARGLMWEFVGGKVENDESKAAALIRECREELDITVKVNNIFCEVVHSYPDIDIHLTLFNAEIILGEPKLLEHTELKWITKSDIPYYNFCPADREILELLQK